MALRVSYITFVVGKSELGVLCIYKVRHMSKSEVKYIRILKIFESFKSQYTVGTYF